MTETLRRDFTAAHDYCHEIMKPRNNEAMREPSMDLGQPEYGVPLVLIYKLL